MSTAVADLVSHVVDDHNGSGKLHEAVVPVVRLQVHGQKGGVPVVGDEDEVGISVRHSSAGHMPGGLRKKGEGGGKGETEDWLKAHEAGAHLNSSLTEKYHSALDLLRSGGERKVLRGGREGKGEREGEGKGKGRGRGESTSLLPP